MGNCGVGFAPVRPGGEDFLIELMEGVEDIPGTALHEGIDWQWESLRRVPRRPRRDAARVLDIAAQVPARRAARLRDGRAGPRGRRPPTRSPRWPTLTEEALRAGAVGFTTSRTILHRSKHGLVPGTDAPPDELLAIGDAIGRGRPRRVPARVRPRRAAAEERRVDGRARPPHRRAPSPTRWPRRRYAPDGLPRRRSTDADALAGRRAARSCPQVSCRPTGMLFGLQSSLHPFITHPTYRRAGRPAARRAGRRACASPRCGPRCWPRSRAPATRSPSALMTALGPDLPARRPARLRAAARVERRPPRPQREGRTPRGGRPRLAARARRQGAAVRPARPATSTTTTRRSGR